MFRLKVFPKACCAATRNAKCGFANVTGGKIFVVCLRTIIPYKGTPLARHFVVDANCNKKESRTPGLNISNIVSKRGCFDFSSGKIRNHTNCLLHNCLPLFGFLSGNHVGAFSKADDLLAWSMELQVSLKQVCTHRTIYIKTTKL